MNQFPLAALNRNTIEAIRWYLNWKNRVEGFDSRIGVAAGKYLIDIFGGLPDEGPTDKEWMALTTLAYYNDKPTRRGTPPRFNESLSVANGYLTSAFRNTLVSDPRAEENPGLKAKIAYGDTSLMDHLAEQKRSGLWPPEEQSTILSTNPGSAYERISDVFPGENPSGESDEFEREYWNPAPPEYPSDDDMDIDE